MIEIIDVGGNVGGKDSYECFSIKNCGCAKDMSQKAINYAATINNLAKMIS